MALGNNMNWLRKLVGKKPRYRVPYWRSERVRVLKKTGYEYLTEWATMHHNIANDIIIMSNEARVFPSRWNEQYIQCKDLMDNIISKHNNS